MDFASFWTAGRAVALGLDPYVNQVVHDPPVWDGVAIHRHARFLYPPPASSLFRPLAALPYATAKWLFMLLSLGALVWAMRLAGRLAGLDRAAWPWLAFGVVVAAYFPVLALLERGQSDSIALALALGAIVSIRDRRELTGGLLLAAAVLLKLHTAFLIPYLVLRRRWRALGGLAIGAASLLLLALALDGPARVRDYVTVHLPRIARHGDGGARESRLPVEATRPLLLGLAPGRTTIDGRVYDVERLRFVLNASLVRTPAGRAIWAGLREAGLPVAPGTISLVLFAAGFAAVAWRTSRGDDPAGFAAALALVVLAAPVGWAMGTVFYLPAAALLLAGGRALWQDRPLASAACSAGIVLAGLPDGPFLSGPLSRLGELKYVAAGLLCFFGLLGLNRERR
jgi:hypothetical protein